ncbi:MAG: DUF2384 domain-containing protein [Acidobacteria bacterium]|nr:DUF2384 domain-containing protein [Acidobacteriota bacterium]
MKKSDTPIQHTDRWSAERLLGLELQSSNDLVASIIGGLPVECLKTCAANCGLAVEGLASIVGLNPAKLARRRAKGRLTSAESDHLVSLANTIACAMNLFSGDKETAAEWFITPSPALGNITPLQMTRTHTGCRAVETAIGRLEHGVFS